MPPRKPIVRLRFRELQPRSFRRLNVADVDAPLLSWAERPWHIVQESVFATCAHMLAAVLAGRDADTSAEDNLKTFALAEAAYAAATTKAAVQPRTA